MYKKYNYVIEGDSLPDFVDTIPSPPPSLDSSIPPPEHDTTVDNEIPVEEEIDTEVVNNIVPVKSAMAKFLDWVLK